MFEGQSQDSLESMMKANPEFRQLYYRHRELDKKAADASLGVLPLDDQTLADMKRQKLALKSQLQTMYERITS